MKAIDFRRKTGITPSPRWTRSEITTEGSSAMDLALQIEQLFRTDRKKYLGFIRQRIRNQEEAEDILLDAAESESDRRRDEALENKDENE